MTTKKKKKDTKKSRNKIHIDLLRTNKFTKKHTIY